MRKIKIILLSLLSILLVVYIGFLVFKTFELYSDNSNSTSIEVNQEVKMPIIYDCTKQLNTLEHLKADFHVMVYVNSENNSISKVQNNITYKILDDSKYELVKADLTDCKDTFNEDKTITCENVSTSNNDNFVGRWSTKYVNDLESDGFRCDLVK